ncbi:hypothetical protein AWC19_06325 [Mycobacterium palustre]|uniref:UspA domain-containing protein n=1 Tax=Mycobacterium palustre TaxID=153971 RepID=A0A1X1ZR14_9MYCO|nr:hypothetical protein AWC19_06325 [Mycobacterium palustre]
MAPSHVPSSVVVGIDGSDAAIAAALWAADEAIARDVPLRLIHAADSTVMPSGPGQDFRRHLMDAEPMLRAAAAAVAATGKTVKVESSVVTAGPRAGLISESRAAELVCVGSLGIPRVGHVLGSTAAALGNAAFCPVAIICPDDTRSTPGGGWIVVSVDNSPDSDLIIKTGFFEAGLRNAPLMALGVGAALTSGERLDHRLKSWRHRFPEVRVHTMRAPGGVAEFIAESPEPIQLAVIGSGQLAPLTRFIPDAAISVADLCSLLVVRR